MHILERVQAACRDEVLREKILVVPSLAIGHQIADAIAFRGTRWVNLRMETVRTISDAVAGLDLVQRGITVLSRAQALAIVERACDRVLDESSYFAALIGQPGLYRAIQKSIDDLRHAGITADALTANAFEDERKARDLAAIMRAYEEELRAQKFVDRFGVIARALELVAAGNDAAWSRDALWMFADDLELTDVEAKLLTAVSGVAPAERAATSACPPLLHAQFRRAAGEENELRGAFRDILRDRSTLDQAEVVYTAKDPYLPLAFELAAEYAIPATFAEGVAATFTRPGQAATGFLHWIATDFDTTHLQRIARAGAINTGEQLAPASFARILRKSFIGWGRDRYVPRLTAHINVIEHDIEDSESEARIESLNKELTRRREALRIAQSMIAIAATPALADATLQFVNSYAAVRNEIDAMALVALRRLLAELAVLEPATLPHPRIAIDRLTDAIASTHVAASNPRPGHLHVAPVRAGGWSGRASLFVLGLDDAKHPGSGLQDPIVLDAERSALNRARGDTEALLLRGDNPARNSARLFRLLERAPRARWTFSFAELDLHDRRGRFPSKDLLEIFRCARNERTAKYDAVVRDSTPLGFLDVQAPLSPSEWWLGERFLRERRDLRDDLFRSYIWLANGERARLARESDAITPWDAKINVAREEIDPRLTGKVYSASQIERMARCPFGWFLERVLKIESIEELTRAEDRWLDYPEFGLLVHEVLETVMREICDAGQPPSIDRHLQRVRVIADEAARRWREDIPPPTESAFSRQYDELMVACEVFLRTEEKRCGEIVPKYFEVPFGTDDADESPIGMIEPLIIPLDGHQLKLRGRIDRVDQVTGTGGWQVWDYKTSSLYEYNSVWRLSRGTKLQHVIYTRALNEMLRRRGIRGKVECSGYYFPTGKGGGARIARDCAPGELEHALGQLFDVIGNGWFPVPDDGKCAFCEFRDLCGDDEAAAERMARKQQANANDPAVQAWRRLQEVE